MLNLASRRADGLALRCEASAVARSVGLEIGGWVNEQSDGGVFRRHLVKQFQQLRSERAGRRSAFPVPKLVQGSMDL
jgi:hypothetical protein